jgi:hypothetical protein
VCVDLVKGFNRVHWRGFRGDDPVDLGLTSAGRFDSADPVISVNDGN